MFRAYASRSQSNIYRGRYVVARTFPGYISFLNAAGENAINSFSDGHTNRSADAWIGFGAAREDLVNIDAGGIRPYNHFYDPFTKLGPTDIPLGYNSSTQLGLNSFLWASTFDALAPNTTIGSIFFTWIGLNNIGASNIWSFQNARQYQWQGLTNPMPQDRSTNFAHMYRAVGQVGCFEIRTGCCLRHLWPGFVDAMLCITHVGRVHQGRVQIDS